MRNLCSKDNGTEIQKVLLSTISVFVYLWLISLFSIGGFAQSTNQSYPTAVLSGEISGKIAARDVGDARLTTYYYVFNGNQGDIFINVVTKNLDGDIDIFTAGSLKPLTKIKIYSDSPDGETGRIVYLRQPERLILRIEGRTPNDEAATFRIKFAGSFAPAADVAETEEPKLPEIKIETPTGVQVNSVGTIVAVKPKPTPKEITDKTDAKEETVSDDTLKDEAKTKRETKAEDEKADKKAVEEENKQIEKSKDETKETAAPVVVITDNLPQKDETKAENDADKEASKENASVKKTEVKPKKKTAKKSSEPNPLASINLIVLFKDGTKIERPMSEVLRVGVDKGILTIISKDGSVGRYSILDVAEMTIK